MLRTPQHALDTIARALGPVEFRKNLFIRCLMAYLYPFPFLGGASPYCIHVPIPSAAISWISRSKWYKISDPARSKIYFLAILSSNFPPSLGTQMVSFELQKVCSGPTRCLLGPRGCLVDPQKVSFGLRKVSFVFSEGVGLKISDQEPLDTGLHTWS